MLNVLFRSSIWRSWRAVGCTSAFTTLRNAYLIEIMMKSRWYGTRGGSHMSELSPVPSWAGELALLGASLSIACFGLKPCPSDRL